MVIVDAPHILKLEDLFEDSEVNDDPEHAARGWWKFTDPAKTVCVGMEETLLFLRDLLKEQRFDVRHCVHDVLLLLSRLMYTF